MNIIRKISRWLCILCGCIGIVTGCKEAKKEKMNVESLIPSAGAYTGIPKLDSNNSEIANIQNPLHKSLIYTKWKFEEFDIDFIGPDKVLITGGIVKKIAPEGIIADYKIYDDGVIEIMVMEMIKTGMWDGRKLVIDGLIGTKSGY